MARQIERIRIVIVAERNDAGALEKKLDSLTYEVSDPSPASGKEFDKKSKSATGVPGFTFPNGAINGVINPAIAAIKSETGATS